MALLKRGSSGPEVEDLQRILNRLGFDPGTVDGDFGAKTRAAVVAFQKRRGLEPDGVVGPNTQRELQKALTEFARDGRSAAGGGNRNVGVNPVGGGGNTGTGGTGGAPTGGGTAPPAISVNRSLRLPAGQYFDAKHPKDLIVLHHTAGGSAKSTFNWWVQTPERIATAYIVERDGTIYEVFDPKSWAYHLGLKGTNGAVDRRSIGIEIACEGGLKSANGRFYRFDKVSDSTLFDGPRFERSPAWRGYSCFVAYTPQQLDSTIRLVDHLLDEFGILRRTPSDHFEFNQRNLDFRGVIGHHHVRRDKSDVHPGFAWDRLVQECRLQKV